MRKSVTSSVWAEDSVNINWTSKPLRSCSTSSLQRFAFSSSALASLSSDLSFSICFLRFTTLRSSNFNFNFNFQIFKQNEYHEALLFLLMENWKQWNEWIPPWDFSAAKLRIRLHSCFCESLPLPIPVPAIFYRTFHKQTNLIYNRLNHLFSLVFYYFLFGLVFYFFKKIILIIYILKDDQNYSSVCFKLIPLMILKIW